MKYKEKVKQFERLLCMIGIAAIIVILIMSFTEGKIKAMGQSSDAADKETVIMSRQNTGERKEWFNPNIPLERDIQNHLRKCSEDNGVPFALALAVIEKESGFDTEADGGDSVGLMQINICHGPREIIILPEENIRIGCWLLGYLFREYNNWDMALTAYNCGETGAEIMYFSKGIYRSGYSEDVMEKWYRWEEKTQKNKS